MTKDNLWLIPSCAFFCFLLTMPIEKKDERWMAMQQPKTKMSAPKTDSRVVN
jgi:hypothetical protein